jgi:hypothetical protein
MATASRSLPAGRVANCLVARSYSARADATGACIAAALMRTSTLTPRRARRLLRVFAGVSIDPVGLPDAAPLERNGVSRRRRAPALPRARNRSEPKQMSASITRSDTSPESRSSTGLDHVGLLVPYRLPTRRSMRSTRLLGCRHSFGLRQQRRRPAPSLGVESDRMGPLVCVDVIDRPRGGVVNARVGHNRASEMARSSWMGKCPRACSGQRSRVLRLARSTSLEAKRGRPELSAEQGTA